MLRHEFGARSGLVATGIGDDAAVLRLPGAKEKWALTTDMLVENIDFRRSWQTPEQLGCRALAVNLSDLAAMGARPRCYTVALGLPAGIGERWIAAFYRGLATEGALHGAVLVGGDFSRTPADIVISIAAIGESVHGRLLFRSGGKSGDILYTTGTLGRAAAGLALLLKGEIRGRTTAEKEAIKAHRTPSPRCKVGLWLAKCGMAGALMDLSDGLSMDLHRLCRASECGAEICLSRLPLFRESRVWGCDPAALALHGAEDFELLFSIRAGEAARFEAAYPRKLPAVTAIGRLTHRRQIVCVRSPGDAPRPLPRQGFDHFRTG